MNSNITVLQAMCWLFQQSLRALAAALMLPGGQTSTCNTRSMTGLKSFFTLHRKQNQKKKKKIQQTLPAQAWTRAPQLWCDPALQWLSSWMAYLVTVAGKHDSFLIMMSWKWVLKGRLLSWPFYFCFYHLDGDKGEEMKNVCVPLAASRGGWTIRLCGFWGWIKRFDTWNYVCVCWWSEEKKKGNMIKESGSTFPAVGRLEPVFSFLK